MGSVAVNMASENTASGNTPSGRHGRRTIAAILLAAAFLVVTAWAGCSAALAATQRAPALQGSVQHGSVQACIRFGIGAIERRVVVRTAPPACRGLTRAQVNFAVASAVHQIAVRVPGKARERRRAAMLSRYLAHLVTAVTVHPPPPTVAPKPTRQVSNKVLGLLALFCWLVTVSLGSYMLARWISRGALRQAFRRRPRSKTGPRSDTGLSPSVSFIHFGLAVGGLLTWIGYLVSNTALVGWIACGLLLPTAGLGMSLVFLGSSRGRPTLVVAAHITLAAATLLLTVLAVVNPTAAGG
jgi:hypothetical protein